MNTRSVQIALLTCVMTAASIGVRAAKCTVSTSGLSFGSYNVFSTVDDTITGSIIVNCTNNAAYTIALSSGSGTYSSRSMTSGTHTLSYNLFLDATYLTVWGDGSAGTSIFNGVGTGANAATTVYGRIPARQNAAVGSYSDVLTVTVTY